MSFTWSHSGPQNLCKGRIPIWPRTRANWFQSVKLVFSKLGERLSEEVVLCLPCLWASRESPPGTSAVQCSTLGRRGIRWRQTLAHSALHEANLHCRCRGLPGAKECKAFTVQFGSAELSSEGESCTWFNVLTPGSWCVQAPGSWREALFQDMQETDFHTAHSPGTRSCHQHSRAATPVLAQGALLEILSISST